MNNLFVLKVIGDAMAPRIIDGDKVFFNSSIKPLPNGKDVAILEVEERYHICRFTRSGRKILMIQDNAPISVIKEESVKIIGKVVHCSFTPIKEENYTAGNDVVI